MSLIYSIVLRVIEWLIVLSSPFNAKAKAFIGGRRQALGYLKNNIKAGQDKLLWVHASSVGEYEQGRPVMELFRARYPAYKILVSFYSPSGYQAIKTDGIIDYKCYLPTDSRKNARAFINLTQPAMAFFIKYEFWHFYLDELSRQGIPLFSISAIFRPGQVFFKWYGTFFRQMLAKFNYFFVQDEPSKDLLATLGFAAMVTGDTRLDRVLAIRDEAVSLPVVEGFTAGQRVFIVGSLRKEDLDLVIDFIHGTPDYKFIVAPHEILEEMMQPLEKEFACQRFTQPGDDPAGARVLIIDTIGVLSKLYRYGHYAYVGGGFSDGIHNILEPAVYELPVFFGNLDYTRFKEALDLTGLGVAFAIGSANEMREIYQTIDSDPERRREIETGLAAYLEMNKGASQRIIDYLNNFRL